MVWLSIGCWTVSILGYPKFLLSFDPSADVSFFHSFVDRSSLFQWPGYTPGLMFTLTWVLCVAIGESTVLCRAVCLARADIRLRRARTMLLARLYGYAKRNVNRISRQHVPRGPGKSRRANLPESLQCRPETKSPAILQSRSRWVVGILYHKP